MVKLGSIHNFSVDRKFAPKLLTPLLSEALGTDDKQSVGVKPSDKLGPDKPGFNRFPEANLIGDEETLRRGAEEFDNGLELIRVELRVGHIDRVNDVAKSAGQSMMDEKPAKDGGIAKMTRLQFREGINRLLRRRRFAR